MVIRAIVRDGALHPVLPLPTLLQEGQAVDIQLEPVEEEVDIVTPERRAEIEAWFAMMQDLALDKHDAQILEAAIAEERRLGKEDARREAEQ